MKLDSVTVVPFPDSAAFGVMHEKFFEPLVNSLNHAYSFADREDAVEEAFYKLMFKKDRDAYEKEPETKSDWFYALRWHARAELSHRRERDGDRELGGDCLVDVEGLSDREARGRDGERDDLREAESDERLELEVGLGPVRCVAQEERKRHALYRAVDEGHGPDPEARRSGVRPVPEEYRQ